MKATDVPAELGTDRFGQHHLLGQWLQQHAVTICCSRWTLYPGNCIKAEGASTTQSTGLFKRRSRGEQCTHHLLAGPSHQGSGKEHCHVCFLQGECQHIWNNGQVVETNPDGTSRRE
ncbi:hypothetical protein D4764_05G0006850 [Takifugu flavidus]|uniref:Uncharacterized protein n=1 Tax=Takifugu flavidus TaxID=433684 RepID=A0A5C6N0J5_9TELE|nr:hypothetical protein D4764_05G0006850 [Takifugu flavidus]